ncbi:methyl-accepting chemotaxis protein [Evansella sp. AB-P1]|uniref:methyl-accepting chemotaxis protein n=1 Tax=Evansella sp. AB-P1 TaxID=3037653 RepID=UPI00241FF12C|nr:methyl-accepting chemotaxis protein [Evansella sp. AB-P1]MDG5787411.1 methyl-accepting chemotaxis protein [Evansella sp. AB-P1]
MFQSIRGKLISFTCIFIILMMITTSFVIFSQLSSNIESSVEENALATGTEVERYIDTYLRKYYNTVVLMGEDQNLREFIYLENEDSVEARRIWDSIANSHKIFMEMESVAQLMYVGTEAGNLHSTPLVDLPDGFDPRERPWYQEAVSETGEVIWTEPYLDVSTGEQMITVAKAITTANNNNVLGVMAIDILLDDLTALLAEIEVGYDGELALLTNNGVVIAHTINEMIGEDLSNQSYIEDLYESQAGRIDLAGQSETIYFDTVRGIDWKVMTVYNDKDLFAELNTTRNLFFIVSAVVIIIAIIGSSIMSHLLTKPIRQLNSQLKRMASGDFTEKAADKGKDEISMLAKSVNEMSDQLKGLIGSIKSSVTDCKTMAEELTAVSEETVATSDEILTAINEVASGATNQAEDIEESNQQMMNFSVKVTNASDKTKEMNGTSIIIKDSTELGIQQMQILTERTRETNNVFNHVSETIEGLSNRVKEINQVINLISEFADQTNLLALNASIEAARAGEHGRGFAIVADEVRKLAEQSMNATVKIRNTIVEVEEETERVVQTMGEANTMSKQQQIAVNDAQESFDSIVSNIETMMIAINQVSTNLLEMDDQKGVIVHSIGNVASVAEQSAATTEQVAASATEQSKAIEAVGKSAEQLNMLSTDLSERVERFKLK